MRVKIFVGQSIHLLEMDIQDWLDGLDGDFDVSAMTQSEDKEGSVIIVVIVKDKAQ